MWSTLFCSPLPGHSSFKFYTPEIGNNLHIWCPALSFSLHLQMLFSPLGISLSLLPLLVNAYASCKYQIPVPVILCTLLVIHAICISICLSFETFRAETMSFYYCTLKRHYKVKYTIDS